MKACPSRAAAASNSRRRSRSSKSFEEGRLTPLRPQNLAQARSPPELGEESPCINELFGMRKRRRRLRSGLMSASREPLPLDGPCVLSNRTPGSREQNQAGGLISAIYGKAMKFLLLRGTVVRCEGELTQPPTAVARGRVERTRQSLKGILCIVEQGRYVVIFKESSVGGSRPHEAVFSKRSSGQQALGALASEEPGKESVATSRIIDVLLFYE